MKPEIKQAISEALAQKSEFERGLIIKAWEDETFRQELLANPKAVYGKEMGREIPDNWQIEIVDEPPGVIKIVLPQKPVTVEAEEELSDEELEAVAGGKPGVGVGIGIGVRF